MISTLILSTVLLFTPIENDTSKFVSMLSWDSFEIHTTTYTSEIALVDSASMELLEIGKKATPFMLKSILDKNKGVVIHLILTKIWRPDSFQVLLDYSQIDAQENIARVKISVNQLAWETTDEDKKSKTIG